MKKILESLKSGLLAGIGFMLVIGVAGLSYASYSWITQTNVNTGDTLTASSWNNVINNLNFAKQELSTKLSKAGDTMAGELNMGGNKISNISAPVASTDVANKAYTDTVVSAAGGNGEGKYQISCSVNNDVGMTCIRLNTITGDTECKYNNNVGSSNYNWGNCNYDGNKKPW